MVMKKFINDPQNLTTELLEGLALAYPGKVKLAGKTVVRANPKSKDKVAIVSLGGSGHEPALSGYVGDGMLDACVVGDIFAAPGAPPILDALRMYKDNAGILFIILNHAGDVMNGDIAYNMAVKEGINVRKILVCDDIAPGADAPREDRRGFCGSIALYKIVGAAAEAGKSLDEIVALAERFNERMCTLSVAMKTATHPQSGQYIATLDDDKMEIGMGQHGEAAAAGPQPIATADAVAEAMVGELILATKVKSGDSTVLFINGSGATTLMEMLIVFRKAYKVLESKGVKVAYSRVEEMLTVQEAAGFQMFLAPVDAEQLGYLKAASDTPYWVSR